MLCFNYADGIHVRVFEERMDLLRACIVGATGTPYHDNLFFFDIFFPPDYPHEPPVSSPTCLLLLHKSASSFLSNVKNSVKFISVCSLPLWWSPPEPKFV